MAEKIIRIICDLCEKTIGDFKEDEDLSPIVYFEDDEDGEGHYICDNCAKAITKQIDKLLNRVGGRTNE